MISKPGYKSGYKAALYVLVAFLLPVVLLMVTFLVHGIFPFGEKSIISNDLYLQYLPIMEELQRVMHEGGSIFYSFKGGAGTNFYALNTYQNASPITWLFLFIFDNEHITLSVTLMILTKIGLSSSAMYYYLARTCEKTALTVPDASGITKAAPDASDKPHVANENGGSVAHGLTFMDNALLLILGAVYSLSGYVIAYYYNVMWLDTVMLLPIVILGLRSVIDGKDVKLYVISLAAMLFTSYYTGAMMCIFIFLYSICYFFGSHKEGLAKAFVRTGLCSLLAALMAMVVLLPSAFALTRTQDFTTIGGGLTGLLYNSIPAHIAQLFPSAHVSNTVGAPNIYSGILPLMLFFMFIANGKISLRERITKGSMVLLLFVSTNVVPLDLFWHFMHAPNFLPARYSFLLTFLLVETAMESLLHLDGLKLKSFIPGTLCVITLFVISGFAIGSPGSDSWIMFVLSAALIMLYAIAFLFIRETGGRISRKHLIVVAALELILVTFHGIGAGGIIKTDRYHDKHDEISKLIEVARKKDPHARLELISKDNPNAPFVHGYNGVSIFASSVPGSTYNVLNAFFSEEEPSINQFTFPHAGVAPDAAFNIRYYISPGKELHDPWVKLVAEENGCFLYENKYHSAIGYMVPEEMRDLDLDKKKFEVLNQFTFIISGEKEVLIDGGIDLDKWDKAYPKMFREKMDVSEMEGNRLSGKIKAGSHGLFMMSVPHDPSWAVKVDGKRLKETESIPGLISFPLEKGTHEIEMKFVPEGFVPGALLSALGVIIFALWCVRKRQRQPGK